MVGNWLWEIGPDDLQRYLLQPQSLCDPLKANYPNLTTEDWQSGVGKRLPRAILSPYVQNGDKVTPVPQLCLGVGQELGEVGCAGRREQDSAADPLPAHWWGQGEGAACGFWAFSAAPAS